MANKTYYDIFGKQVNAWLDDDKVPYGMNKNNVIFLREYKELYHEFRKSAAMLFFMLTKMNITAVRQMMVSASKTANFIASVKMTLKEKKVTKEYVRHLEHSAQLLRNRLETINRIIKENLYLTEYYPYFEEQGFEMLSDFKNDGSHEEQLQHILDDFEQWKSNNPDILAKHLEESAKEKAIHEAHLKKIAEMKKAEKEAKKMAKKIADDEVKEIKANEKKHMQEYRKIEKSFKRYYEGKC